MADTVGGLIDKLITVDTKLWNCQELLYEIRRNNFEYFVKRFFENEQKVKELWDSLRKICDLNLQRGGIIDEIDKRLIFMIKEAVAGKEIDNGINVQIKHKTLLSKSD